MKARNALRKTVDDAVDIRCASGSGSLREEVWEDETGRVVRYNLAFINHFLTREDNGRVLGYDNSHGHHHRHFKGRFEPFAFERYSDLRELFIAEVSALKEELP